MSMQHAFSARWRFAQNIARGEPGMGLAEAALLVAAGEAQPAWQWGNLHGNAAICMVVSSGEIPDRPNRSVDKG